MTKYCGSGRKSLTMSMSLIHIFGTLGRTKTGSIGAAYGYQLGIKNHYREGDFDQVDRVLYDLKHNPNSRPDYDQYL